MCHEKRDSDDAERRNSIKLRLCRQSLFSTSFAIFDHWSRDESRAMREPSLAYASPNAQESMITFPEFDGQPSVA